MPNHLTFIIPVRHPDNAKNLTISKRNLRETLRSIAAQTISDWNAKVVANRGADLPELPPNVEVVYVDFPPNPLHERQETTQELFYDFFRLDKGRRVLAGLLASRPTGHVMAVDDDDFVSARLAAYVRDNCEEDGWIINCGYVWSGGKVLFLHADFANLCGTSHIVRADLLNLPSSMDEAEDEYVRRMLGSHILMQEDLYRTGARLKPLPFPGAVYRVGHEGAHSQSTGMLREYFLNKSFVKSPRTAVARLLRLRFLSSSIRQEFFKGNTPK